MVAQVSAEVVSSVQGLSRIFTVVMALSIGEAFKQFVSDKSGENGTIYWWRLPLLIAFIALVIPFSHGMTRYFDHVYLVSPSANYSIYALIDTVAFTVESVMFFVLSRSLLENLWRQFFIRFAILLGLDAVWGFFAGANQEASTMEWVKVNRVFLVVIVLIIMAYFIVKKLTAGRFEPSDKMGAIAVALFVVTRTIFDYAYTFEFYFPKP